MTEIFDRFAEVVARQVARAWFFTACCLLILVWAPSVLFGLSLDTWQLIINTATTIVTFLMVALLQNSQTRADRAVTHKLDALLQGLAEVLDNTDGMDSSGALAGRIRSIAGVELEPSE